LCVVCTTIVNWYCPISDDTIVFFGCLLCEIK
jgi:hypothetical protein